MRLVQAAIFLIFLLAVGIFAMQNTDVMTFRFASWTLTGPVALLTIAVYLLGMLSGWTVVAYVQNSLRRVAQHPRT